MIVLPKNIICGYFDCSEFKTLSVSPKRIATRYEIEFYLADGEYTYTNDKNYNIAKNYIHITKPGQERYSLLPFYTLFIKFDAVGDIAELLDSAPEHFCSSHPEVINNKLEEIIMLSENKNQLLLHSRVLSLLNLVLLDSKIPTSQNGKNYEIIQAAKRFIERNFNQPITLSNIANSVHLSETHFHNIFTTALGISPHQYLINCRIDNAKRLLWNAKIPITKIAEDTGFGCQQYFNKVFKKETGETPASYRKSFSSKYLL